MIADGGRTTRVDLAADIPERDVENQAVATPTPPATAGTPAPAGAASAVPHMHKVPKRWPVVLIGIGKLFKSAGLVILMESSPVSDANDIEDGSISSR